MKYAFCNTTLIPARAEASDKSEQVTQLLFGQLFVVLAENEKWAFVRLESDQYEAWIDLKLVCYISEEAYQLAQKNVSHVSQALVAAHHINSNSTIWLSYGAEIPNCHNGSFAIGEHQYRIDPAALDKPALPLVTFCQQVLNTPYLWGGKSLFGFDCSGFTQVFYKLYGISLPRDAYQQALIGTTINKNDLVNAGDLAYFQNEAGKITHVGICLGEGYIIHASGKIRIDQLNEEGIYLAENQRYSHKLSHIQRVF